MFPANENTYHPEMAFDQFADHLEVILVET